MKFTIPIAPITKKNSQEIVRNPRNGRMFIMPSKQYRKYEAEAAKYVPSAGKPIDYPVNVQAIFYMPTHRKVDKTNLEEALHDVLVHAGLIKDDNRDIIAASDGTRVYYSKNNPRTEVTITAIPKYQQWSKRADRVGEEDLCDYNDGVSCKDHTECGRCGWCPPVEESRIKKIRSARERKE